MTGSPTAKNRVRVSQDDILDLFLDYKVLTLDQIQTLLGAPTQFSIRNQIKKLSGKNNTTLVTRILGRPWTGPKNRFTAVFLGENGANALNLRYQKRIVATSPNTLSKNMIHSVGVVDIGIALKKVGLQFNIEHRLPVDEESSEYIRPDVICWANGISHMIEFEQTRAEHTLKDRILNRFRRWQKMLSDPENDSMSRDVFVLFSLDVEDKHTISKWMEALYALEEEIGTSSAFTVRIMNLADFLKSPTLTPAKFNSLIPSEHPETDLLAAARKQALDRVVATRIKPEDAQRTFDNAIAFWKEYRTYFLTLENSIATRKLFLDGCDRLYWMASLREQMPTSNASLPWGAINTLRRWLEEPVLSDFRVDLIDATERFKSSYSRGTAAAIDALDRLVWEVLLRKFDIGRGGSLSFRVQIGSDSKDDKHQRPGLIPVFSISLPWEKIRETEEDAEITCQALAWLVTLIMDFQTELGLTRTEKKTLSSVLLDPTAAQDG